MKLTSYQSSVPMKNGIFPLLIALVMLSLTMSPAASQAEGPWSPPVNISRSGGATNPAITIDSNGVQHVIWADSYAGFMYSKNAGEGWTEPVPVIFPFSPPRNDTTEGVVYPTPILMSDTGGRVHAFWIDAQNMLNYSRVAAAGMGIGGAWSARRVLVDSALSMDITQDAMGNFHLAYIRNLSTPIAPSGVYYTSMSGTTLGWTQPLMLVETPYFRSIAPENANVSISTAVVNEAVNVYIAWDNQPRNRVMEIHSRDGGANWTEPSVVDGPEVSTGPVMPRNIRVGAYGSDVVVIWQVDEPGESCLQNYQWSNDAGDTWQGRQRMLTQIQGCAEDNQFMIGSGGRILLMTKVLGQVYLHAWDGTRWSDSQFQDILSSFIDEETYNLVDLRCQYAIMSGNDTLSVAGCDTGIGGDIWLTSRQITSTEGWFSPETSWGYPITVAGSHVNYMTTSLAADENGFTHLLWAQTDEATASMGGSTLQYSRWDGRSWSAPLLVFGAPITNVNPPTIAYHQGRLYAAFTDRLTGEVNFTSADSSKATDPREWSAPILAPVPRPAADSPQVQVAPDGTLFLAYAIPINEFRGIYLIRSEDGGKTWTPPDIVFDAVEAGWSMVDNPRMSFTDADHMFMIFTQYSQAGGNQPMGLYYTHSENGGASWAEPIPMTEEATYGSDIRGVGSNNVHIVWQEWSDGNFTVWHNVSGDNGIQWAGRNSMRSSGTVAMLSQIVVDGAGQIHLLQLTKEEQDSISLTHWIWNSPQWSVSDLSKFQVESSENAHSLMGTVTHDLRLVAIYSIPVLGQGQTAPVDTIFSTERLLDGETQPVAAEGELSPPALENTPVPVPTNTPAAVAGSPTPADVVNTVQSTPVIDNSPIERRSQWTGLITGVVITTVIVIVIFIFGLNAVRKRGLE